MDRNAPSPSQYSTLSPETIEAGICSNGMLHSALVRLEVVDDIDASTRDGKPEFQHSGATPRHPSDTLECKVPRTYFRQYISPTTSI